MFGGTVTNSNGNLVTPSNIDALFISRKYNVRELGKTATSLLLEVVPMDPFFDRDTNDKVDSFVLKLQYGKTHIRNLFLHECSIQKEIYEKSVSKGHVPPICPQLLWHKWFMLI